MAETPAGNCARQLGAAKVRRWWRTLFYLLACQFVRLPVCIAQEATPDPLAPTLQDSGPTMLASFGWGGTCVADRWGPITVYVTTGERAVAGLIVVDFPQDETQSARIAVPFAATPNKTTLVPIVAALPGSCDRVRFTMVDEHGRDVRSISYTQAMSDRTASLPPLLESARGVFVCVGRCSLADSLRTWTSAGEPVLAPRTMRAGKVAATRAELDWAWTRAAAGQAPLEELPSSWMAYDGVVAVVVNPQSFGPSGRTADPRAIEAVQAWVRSGGRLVVIADGPGDGWRAWIPEEARALVDLDPAGVSPLPRVVSDAVAGAMRASAQPKTLENEPQTSPEPTLPGPAAAAACRVVHISDAAARLGWNTRWEVGPGISLLAEGPVGYGQVVVLGLDPMRAPAQMSAKAAAPVWKSALEPAAMDWLRRAGGAQSSGYWTGGPQDRASNAAIERVGDVPVIGDSIFVVIAGAVLVLVALVGPGDYFILRRLKAGQRSWMTALLWIALACGFAYAAPRLLRTAPTQINRLSVVDRIVAPAGATGPPQTYCAAITGVYAGESGTARVVDPDPTSWWRGKAASYGDREFNGLALVPTVQAAAGGAAGSTRGNPLREVPMALWTFRAFADDSAAAGMWSGLDARVRGTPEGYRVVVAGLPAGVIVNEAAVHAGESWYGLKEPAPVASRPQPAVPPVPPRKLQRPEPAPIVPVGEMESGSWSALFPDKFTSPGPSRAWTNPVADSGQGYFVPWYYGQALDTTPGPLLDLAGADRRGQGVDRYVATGRFAAVYLNVVGCPSDVNLEWASKKSHEAVLRLVVPLEDAP